MKVEVNGKHAIRKDFHGNAEEEATRFFCENTRVTYA